MNMKNGARRTLTVALLVLSGAIRAAAEEPGWLAGYAAGVLENEYGVRGASVTVDGSTLTLSAPGLTDDERRGAARTLLTLPDVSTVRFVGDGRLYAREFRVNPRAWRALPRVQLFAPLLADPRWPQFSGTVTRHFRTDQNLVFNGNVGDSFALAGGRDWQFGLQATVFTQFDMKARHDDQLTDDFLFGLPYSWRAGRWTWMARLYHISTHTGDEFLLHHPGFNRVKISVEAVDLRGSYDVGSGWRLYGGPGYLYRHYPIELKPLYVQGGVEYAAPRAWARGLLRPVAALDLQKHQQYGWGATNVSARAGFQIEHRSQTSRRVLLLLEYYRGRDVNGQFYVNQDESLGLGLHLYF
jgi:hypothetical protein